MSGAKPYTAVHYYNFHSHGSYTWNLKNSNEAKTYFGLVTISLTADC